jgi:tyrosinase
VPVSTFTSQAIGLDGLAREFSRADIEFHDVDHAGASYEGRVFLDNPSADETTPKSPEAGYAGSFHIFGHGGCFGDEGHCDVVPRRKYDPRPAHQLTPAKKVVIATDAVRRVLQQGHQTTVTVVPVITSLTPKSDTDQLLKFDRVTIVTYR